VVRRRRRPRPSSSTRTSSTPGFRRTDRLTVRSRPYSRAAGCALGKHGRGARRRRLPALSGSPPHRHRLRGDRDSAYVAPGTCTFDTLDDANFPRRGLRRAAQVDRIFFRGRGSDPLQNLPGRHACCPSRGALHAAGDRERAHSRDDRGGFSLGGLFNLSGTPDRGGERLAHGLVAALGYYRIGELLPRAIGRSVYVGASLEAGNAWQSTSTSRYGDCARPARSSSASIPSSGAMYFAVGKTFGGDTAVYLFLGRPTDRLGN
jgi:NTE family protein